MFSTPTSLFLSLPCTHTNTGSYSPSPLFLSTLLFSLFSLFFSDSPPSPSLSNPPSPPLLWLYTHPTPQLEQSSRPDRREFPTPFFSTSSAQPDATPAFITRLFPVEISKSQFERVESRRAASLAPLFTVCLTLIHCLNVNAMNECCIYLMLRCMWTPASLSHFLHCPLPSAVFAEMTGTLLCFMWDCPSKSSPLPPLYFTFVTKAFICTSLNRSARCWFSTDSVTPRSCTSTKTRQRSTRRTFNSSSAALTVLTIMFQLRLSQLCCCRRLTDSGRIPTSLLKLFKLS